MGLLDLANDPGFALGMGLLGGGSLGQAGLRGITAAQASQLAQEERKLRESQALENKARAQHYQDQQRAAQASGQRDAQFQQALQQGVPPAELARYFPEKIDTLKKLADAPNFGRQAVARTIEVEGPGGTKMIRQLDQFGEATPGGDMPGYVPPQLVNLGNKQLFAKPAAGQSFDIGMSPSERDASARGWASNRLAQERFKFDQQGGAEGGKPPAGYRWSSDKSTLEPIPGGPAAGNKLTESEGKSTLYLSQMREATKALESIGGDTSPLMVAATGSPYTNWMAGENSQKAGQSQRQWAEAYLREKTGAAATAGEVENNIRTFFPVVGDSAAVIAQKKAARADAERAMEIPAGRGAGRIPGASDEKPANLLSSLPTANASNRGKRIRDTTTGKVLVSNGMQWKEE